jgi:protein-disulfide isomerase
MTEAASRTRRLLPILLLRLAILAALFGCATLAVEYAHAGDAAFCGPASGCAAVRGTKWSHLGNIPLPAVGLSAFGALYVLALAAHNRLTASYAAAAALAGGLLGAGFIALQKFEIGVYCKWCLLVDGAAIVAALAASVMLRDAVKSPAAETFLGAVARARRQIATWIAAVAIATTLPVVWAEYPVDARPPGVIALGVPDKITVVSFTDFECPFCRKLHPVVKEIVAAANGRMALVRKMTPLDFHRGARPAARAYVCTPEPQKEAMADALYEAADRTLARPGLIALATGMGIDAASFTRCFDAAETEEAIKADLALMRSFSPEGARVPTTFFGARVVSGYRPDAARQAAAIALAGGRVGLPVGWMLVAFAVVAATAAAFAAWFSQKGW